MSPRGRVRRDKGVTGTTGHAPRSSQTTWPARQAKLKSSGREKWQRNGSSSRWSDRSRSSAVREGPSREGTPQGARCARSPSWSPGALWLLAIVIYPAIVTIKDSFFNETDTKAVGLTNYKDLFTTAETLIAFRNNVIWVIVFPFVVTTIGLVLAVLTERIRWATAFKTIIFLPVVFSVTASSMVFAQIFDSNPQVGVANAIDPDRVGLVQPPRGLPAQPGHNGGLAGFLGDTGGRTGRS